MSEVGSRADVAAIASIGSECPNSDILFLGRGTQSQRMLIGSPAATVGRSEP